MRDRKAWIYLIRGTQYVISALTRFVVILVYSVCRLDKIGSLSDWEKATMNEEVQELIKHYFR